MQSSKVNRQVKRRQSGHNVVEIGPALFIFFVLVLFPLVDLLALSFSYSCGWYLNYVQTREASIMAQFDRNGIINGLEVLNRSREIAQQWQNSGLGAYVNEPPGGRINFSIVEPESGNSFMLIVVTTTMRVQPFVSIPAPVAIPGLNSPVTFTFSSQRPVEGINLT